MASHTQNDEAINYYTSKLKFINPNSYIIILKLFFYSNSGF